MRSCGHVQSTIPSLLQSLFSASFTQVAGFDVQADISRSKVAEYQCNSALRLAKQMGIKPFEIAQKVVAQIKDSDLISKLEVAGPGFINITINPKYLSASVNKQLQSPTLGIDGGKQLRIIIDFSSPNTAKEMHVGHLRSTIIGDSLARTFEFLGHDVVRLNHIGDWGTAFGMLIAHIKSQEDFSLQKIEQSNLQELMRLYKESKKRFDEDPFFKKQSQMEVVALQGGDETSRKIWESICTISRNAYQEIYEMLGVHIQERGESFYNPYLSSVVQELEQKGLVTVSDGAKCIFVEGFENRDGEKMPLIVQKSDGGFNYDTTDMAAIFHRIRDEKADWLVYVTDMGQALHFDMIFKAAEKAKVLDLEKTRVDHVPFGLVLGSDGKKFKTRSGDTEKLVDLLNEAVERAEAILQTRNPDWPEAERKKIAHILGLGAVKYADLSCHRGGDYTFSYDRMLRFEGNTAAFIMYSYVRTQSIKRKIGTKYKLDELKVTSLVEPNERALALQLAQFPEAIEAAAQELLPNRLTEYLYSLSEQFNLFFRDCRVEGDPNESSRLALVEATGRVLKQGLSLLGIDVPERM